MYSSAGNGTSQPIFDVRIVLICRKRDISTYFRCIGCTHLQEKGHLNLIWDKSCIHHLYYELCSSFKTYCDCMLKNSNKSLKFIFIMFIFISSKKCWGYQTGKRNSKSKTACSTMTTWCRNHYIKNWRLSNASLS